MKVKVARSCLTLCDSMDCSPWNSVGQNTGVDSLSLLQGIFHPGIETRSPSLQADSLPARPQEKLKNTGVGNLSLLQGIFPTQESNQGHLHCRRILSQLSYEGSPDSHKEFPQSCIVGIEMATHSNILARRIAWTEEPGGLLSMGLHRVRHD